MHFSLQIAGADMAVSMLQLLLLTAVTQANIALTDSMLTTDALQKVLSLWTVAHRNIAQGNPLVVSLPQRDDKRTSWCECQMSPVLL